MDPSAAEGSEHGREGLPDVAQVLSIMCTLIVIRNFAHRIAQAFAEHASVPVINALTDHSHPCQILSNLYALKRAGRDLDRMTVAWVGDGNNVLHSWLQAATLFGVRLNVAVMDGPQSIVIEQAENRLHLQKGLMAALARGIEARGKRSRERQAVAATR